MSRLLLRSLRHLTPTRTFSAPPSSSNRFASSSPSTAPSPISAPPPTPSSSAAAGVAADHVSEAPIPPPGAAEKLWNRIKIPVLAILTAGVGSTAYASYAYSLEEVGQKRKALIERANGIKMPENASSFQKFQTMVHSAAIEVPIKTIELYMDIRNSIEEHVRGFAEPVSDKLLPDLHPLEQHVYTIVLDLNETLVYSDWTRERGWRTFKRPGVDAFLEHLGKYYEIVIYSDQLNVYVDPIIDRLDQKGVIRAKLSRPATKYVNGKHYRDLSKLNRDPARIIYISGHALENTLQPANALPIRPWKLEDNDTALVDLIPFLEFVQLNRPADIRTVLASYEGCDLATEFIERSKELQKRLQGQQSRAFWRR